VAFTATGLLQLGIQPFYRVFFPRFSELVATGQSDLLRREYFRSCQLVATMVIPLGIVGFLFAPQLLGAWLGRIDPTIVLVFRCLLVAISCTGLMWLPAAFQQAHGWTKLHAGMIIGALILGAPVMLVAIRTIGTAGATTVWLFHGISGITLELWLMHQRLLVGALAEWYRKVLVLPALVASPIAGVSWWLTPAGLGRWGSLAWVAGTVSAIVIAVLAFRVAAIRADRQLTYFEVG
jgi:O-antigen/teichoic acid export membrane protein